MAIFNPQKFGLDGSNWQYATFKGNTGPAYVSSISFSVSGRPLTWALVCSDYGTNSPSKGIVAIRHYTISAYYDGNTITSAEVKSGSTTINVSSNLSTITTSYANGTFAITTSLKFPMRRGSSTTYYMTWTLFYTV